MPQFANLANLYKKVVLKALLNAFSILSNTFHYLGAIDQFQNSVDPQMFCSKTEDHDALGYSKVSVIKVQATENIKILGLEVR